MVFWNPDTCNCRIEIDSNFNFLDWEKKCELHKNFNGSELLKEVLTHNKNLNLQFGSIELNETQKTIIRMSKQTEYSRINSLGKGTEK